MPTAIKKFGSILGSMLTNKDMKHDSIYSPRVHPVKGYRSRYSRDNRLRKY